MALRELGSEDFNVQQFVAKIFRENSDNQVKDTLNNLTRRKEESAKQLVQNVFSNYEKFIFTSKEISKLEKDMSDMRHLLTNFQDNLKTLSDVHLDFGTAEPEREEKREANPSESDRKRVLDEVQWLLDAPADIEVFTAERRFEEAVALIEAARGQVREPSTPTVTLVVRTIKTRLEDTVEGLLSVLATDLRQPALTTSEARRVIGFMLRLEYSRKAEKIFLETRSESIHRAIKSLKFEGDICLYISELAHLVFSQISATCDHFRTCFTDGTSMSNFMVWVVEELHVFVAIFKRQVFTDDDYKTIAECMAIADAHAKLLEARGLSLWFIVRGMIISSMEATILSSSKKVSQSVMSAVGEEQWNGREMKVIDLRADTEGKKKKQKREHIILKLSESAKSFYVHITKFVADVNRILTIELYEAIVVSVCGLFEEYVQRLKGIMGAEDASLTDKDYLVMIANVFYLNMDLVPKLTRRLQKRFERPVVEVEKLRKRLEADYVEMRNAYAGIRAKGLLENKLKWHEADYATTISNVDKPSATFQELFVYMAKFTPAVGQLLAESEVPAIVARIYQEIAFGLGDDAFFSNVKPGGQKFGFGGLSQFALDMKFFLAGVGPTYLTPETTQYIDDVTGAAIVMFCKATGNDPDSVLKSNRWFEERVATAMEELRKKMGDGARTARGTEETPRSSRAATTTAAAAATGGGDRTTDRTSKAEPSRPKTVEDGGRSAPTPSTAAAGTPSAASAAAPARPRDPPRTGDASSDTARSTDSTRKPGATPTTATATTPATTSATTEAGAKKPAAREADDAVKKILEDARARAAKKAAEASGGAGAAGAGAGGATGGASSTRSAASDPKDSGRARAVSDTRETPSPATTKARTTSDVRDVTPSTGTSAKSTAATAPTASTATNVPKAVADARARSETVDKAPAVPKAVAASRAATATEPTRFSTIGEVRGGAKATPAAKPAAGGRAKSDSFTTSSDDSSDDKKTTKKPAASASGGARPPPMPARK